jgi:hypothetical protein
VPDWLEPLFDNLKTVRVPEQDFHSFSLIFTLQNRRIYHPNPADSAKKQETSLTLALSFHQKNEISPPHN